MFGFWKRRAAQLEQALRDAHAALGKQAHELEDKAKVVAIETKTNDNYVTFLIERNGVVHPIKIYKMMSDDPQQWRKALLEPAS